MRWVQSIFFVAVVIMPSIGHAAPSDDSIAFIRIVGPNGDQKDRGSGVLMTSEGMILTAKHIFSKYQPDSDHISVSLRGRDASPVPGREFRCDNGDIDICIISISPQNVKLSGISEFYTPSCDAVEAHAKISMLGYPIGQFASVENPDGKVTGSIGDHFMFPADMNIKPGMSGGPIFDERNRVIGVLFGAPTDQNGNIIPGSFFTPLYYARSILTDARITCPGDNPAGPAQSLSAATITLTSWFTGGWNILITNPIRSQVTISSGILANSPNRGEMAYGFPIEPVYPLRQQAAVGQSPNLSALPEESASQMQLILFGNYPQGCANWRTLRQKLFNPADDFGRTTCRIKLSLVSVSGEQAEIVSEAFQCNRIPVSIPQC